MFWGLLKIPIRGKLRVPMGLNPENSGGVRMRNILQEFFHGNIEPNGEFERNSEYGKAVKRLAEAERKLIAELNEKEKALYDEYAAAQMAFSDLENADIFANGYIIATAMMIQVMTGIDNLIL